MTRTSAQRIVLFRDPRAEDPYEQVLSDAGFQVAFVPVLAFRPMQERAFADALGRPEGYSGLVITSERTVRRLLDRPPEVLEPWTRAPVYSIGPRTSALLKVAGFMFAAPPTPTGRELAEQIRQVHRDDRPLLFPCSAQRRDELPDALRQADVALEEIPVYQTVPVRDVDVADMNEPHWAACFSPSGVRAVAHLLQTRWQAVRRVAIGTTTGSAMDQAGLPPHAIAETPDAQGLLRAIRQAPSAS